MTATKRDGVTTVEGEATEGAKRLGLSITRMKKLRSGLKSGLEIEHTPPGEQTQQGTGSRTWMLPPARSNAGPAPARAETR